MCCIFATVTIAVTIKVNWLGKERNSSRQERKSVARINRINRTNRGNRAQSVAGCPTANCRPAETGAG